MPTIAELVRVGFSPKQAQLICDPNGGWSPPSLFETTAWAYASATTITVPTDATTYYQVGDRVRFKQGGGYKYGVLVLVAATLLTIWGGTDYTVANAAITDYEISREVSPVGFPAQFNYTPTFTGFSVDPTNFISRGRVDGNYMSLDFKAATSGTSNATTCTLTAPIASKNLTNAEWAALMFDTVDNTTVLGIPGVAVIAPNTTTINCYPTTARGLWTALNNKRMGFSNLRYEI